MEMVTEVQILNKADYVSLHINTLWKGMNPNVLPSAMSSLVLVRQPVYDPL